MMFHRWLVFVSFLAISQSHAFSYPRPNNRINIKIPDQHDINECVKDCECTVSNGKNLLNCAKMALTESRLDPIENDYLPEILDLSDNSIEYLDSSLMLTKKQRKSIKTLDLRNNKITKIDPNFFAEFSNLQVLYLDHNKLGETLKEDNSYLARLWKDNKSLKELYLSHNNINSLVSFTFQLPNLKVLHLDGNNELYKAFVAYDWAPLLEELSLQNCGFQSLSWLNYENLQNLKRLYLADNPILSFSFNPNMMMIKLEKLDLSKTHLINLATNWLQSSSLKQLSLREMPYLHTIQECAFCGVPNLNTLELQSSPSLEEIDSNAFGEKKPKLERLNLEHCNLTTLSKDLLEWKNVKDLFIGSNPYNCDENLRWLIEDKQINIEKVGPEPRCAKPLELAGQKLREIKMVRNIEKSTQPSKQRDPIKATWYPWLKQRTTQGYEPWLKQRTTREYRYWTGLYYNDFYTTEAPDRKPKQEDLSGEIVKILRQWFEKAKSLSQDPLTLFVLGFLSGLLALSALWIVYKIFVLFIRLLFGITKNYLWPGVQALSKCIVVPLIAIVKLLVLAVVVLIGWLTNRSVDQIRDFYLKRENYIRLMAEKGKNVNQSSPVVNHVLDSHPVVIYDPVTESASTVQ